MKVVTIVFLFLLVAAPAGIADMFKPSPICSAPYKPYRFNSEYEYDAWMQQVRQYRQCIARFVDEQYEASERHMQAAEEAIEEWNRYARDNLQ